MTTSKYGINLIKKWESCRLTAYVCPAGVLTIGYGHTGKDVKKGMVITKKKANELLINDLKKFEKLVMKYDNKYHWNQAQFDSLVSFAFNIGNIDTLTRNGTRTIAQISEAMLLYKKGGGVVLQGLVNRRLEEQALFNSGCIPTYYKTKAVSGLYCRECAKSNGKIIGAFAYNTKVELLEKKNATWYKVKGTPTNGKTICGYSSSKYLTKV